jgi:predicted metal-dependent TIM-barrel fold hydrolase
VAVVVDFQHLLAVQVVVELEQPAALMVQPLELLTQVQVVVVVQQVSNQMLLVALVL